VWSKEGAGSTFTIRLPLSQPDTFPARDAEHGGSGRGAGYGLTDDQMARPAREAVK
jgi:hypothetical protein